MVKLKIKEFRILRNISQIELAKLLNVKQQRLSEYELNKVNPSLEKLIKLSDLLNCTIDELIDKK